MRPPTDAGGYVKLARKVFDDPCWTEKRVFSRFEAWLDVIQLAQWKPYVHSTKGGSVPLGRGEFIASLRYLATRWGWSVKRTRLRLEAWQGHGQIRAQRGAQAGTVYLVVNYDAYQGTETPKGTARGTERAQQGHKNEEGEEGEAVKKGKYPAALDRWRTRIGRVTPKTFDRLLGPAIEHHGEAAVIAAIDAYAESKLASASATKLDWFADEIELWVQRARTPRLVPAAVNGARAGVLPATSRVLT